MENINSRPIIIDTDPGVDDALAILFAHRAPVLQIQGITTVFGNQDIEKTTRNACSLIDMIGARTPVYRGASRPLTKYALRAESHGETGLGSYQQNGKLRNEMPLTKPAEGDGISFLARGITPRTQIACLGPTTNLALLANLYPEALRQADALIIMGGVFGQVGNTTPWAEFNVYCDPDALAQLLAFNGVKKILIPADICREVTMSETDFLHMQDSSLSQAIQEIIQEYVTYYKSDHIHGGFAGGVMYDTLVIACLLWPELFNTELRHVVVETGDGPARGATAVDLKRNSQPNCLLITHNRERVPSGIDAQTVKQRLLQLLT